MSLNRPTPQVQTQQEGALPTASPDVTAAPVPDAGGDPTFVPSATMEPEESPSNSPVPAAEPTASPAVTPEAVPTSVPEEQIPSGLSDAEFMQSLTIAFLDGITEVTPQSPKFRIEAAIVRVPEDRIGSAQWFIDGIPADEYYAPEFRIYNGKVTGLNFEVPFSPEYAAEGAMFALEVHLNGNVRRIEKYVAFRNYTPEEYAQMNAERVLREVKPVEIEATIRRKTTAYTDRYLSKPSGVIEAGTDVIYVDHNSEYAAYIWYPEKESFYWVSYSDVKVSNKNYTVFEDFPDADKEIFVNQKGYISGTDYLVWINLERQKVNVFLGEEGNWKLEKTLSCATGANITPTPTREYIYSQRSTGWFHPTYYVKPVLYMDTNRQIAMHSILYAPGGGISDGTMGTPVSHGCVRMPQEDIDWLDHNLPIGTKVVVF